MAPYAHFDLLTIFQIFLISDDLDNFEKYWLESLWDIPQLGFFHIGPLQWFFLRMTKK